MRVISIEPSYSEVIETDADEWPTYRRYGPDNWENLMGESWETVFDTERLEAAYQAAKAQK